MLVTTLLLVLSTLSISLIVGIYTSYTAWLSGNKFAYYAPILTLAIPPWLFGFYLDFHPWVNASLSLGLTCSVYVHVTVLNYLLSSNINLLQLRVFKIPTYKLFNYKALFPAIGLVSAEVLADYGVSNFFGIQTLTVDLFNTYSSTYSFAAIIPNLIILFILAKLTKSRFINTDKPKLTQTNNLYLVSLIPTVIVFLIPSYHVKIPTSFPYEVVNSLYLLVIVSTLTLFIKTRFWYGVPNIVIGLVFLYLPIPIFVSLVLALTLKYSGLVNRDYNTDLSKVFNFKAYHNYKQQVTLSFLIVSLEVIREIPITLILQPYNFKTLSIEMYSLAKIENFELLSQYSFTFLVFSTLISTLYVKCLFKK